MTNQYVGAKRYKLTSGHSDDAGLGGEGYMVRMSDHYPSFDTAQKWVKSEDYEALRQRFEKACERVTEPESAVEPTRERDTCRHDWNARQDRAGIFVHCSKCTLCLPVNRVGE